MNANRRGWIIAGVAAVVLVAVLVWLTFPRWFYASDAQSVLPFEGLDEIGGVAVDSGGTVVVSDAAHDRVLRLAAGAKLPEELPFDGLNKPKGVAIGDDGAVYVADSGNGRILKLAAGATTPSTLPFTYPVAPTWLTLDRAGDVYCVDNVNSAVYVLPTGSPKSVSVTFGLGLITGLAAESTAEVYGVASNVLYAGKSETSVMRSGTGASSATKQEPTLDGMNEPTGLAIDAAGAWYIADKGDDTVVKVTPGSSGPEVLDFFGLDKPDGVAVDGTGNVYVADSGNQRVVKLAAS